MTRSSRFRFQTDLKIVRSADFPESRVPAGVPLHPDGRVLSSVCAYVINNELQKPLLEVRREPTRFSKGDAVGIGSHEDLYPLRLSWRDAVYSAADDAGQSDWPDGLRDALAIEYVIAIHAIGARKAWEGESLHAILDGLAIMKYAITEQATAKLAIPSLLSPFELIRQARWGRLLATGPEQPSIGRWHPQGGLIYSERGSVWQALAPLTDHEGA